MSRCLGTPCEKVSRSNRFPDIGELDRSDVVLGVKIGEGMFGEVYKGILMGKMNAMQEEHIHGRYKDS
jgi:hypothetical protein